MSDYVRNVRTSCRFVRLRARSVSVREFNKAAVCDSDLHSVVSSDTVAAAPAACRQVMLSDIT